MLELRPNCQCCGAGLSPDAAGAFICSFECTFCARCALEVLKGCCPNCGGGLEPRPSRPARLLAKYPPSGARIVNDGGCLPAG